MCIPPRVDEFHTHTHTHTQTVSINTGGLVEESSAKLLQPQLLGSAASAS